jgi:predicted TPR repeat methyltransferase
MPPSNDDFEAAKAHFLDGLRCQEAGQFLQAEQHYRASLQRLPGRPSTLTNLGATLLALARPGDALPLLEQATLAEPEHAEGWLQQARALAQLGRLPEALPCATRVTVLQDSLAEGWALRGALLKDLGQPQAAAKALQRALELGAEPEVNGYLLASLTGAQAPARPPRGYVEQLFDGYADTFDAQLVGQLQYRAPQVLAQLLAAHGAQTVSSALDLGCGTGLCGPHLRPRAQRLLGVDLSPRMLALARARGVYDELLRADIVEHLQHDSQRHGLLVAADVFIYIGDLAPVFTGAARVLQAGGLFAFSVEEAPEAVDYELRPSSRYAQSERYLHALALANGFEVLQTVREPLRTDQRIPVAGLYLLLRTLG